MLLRLGIAGSVVRTRMEQTSTHESLGFCYFGLSSCNSRNRRVDTVRVPKISMSILFFLSSVAACLAGSECCEHDSTKTDAAGQTNALVLDADKITGYYVPQLARERICSALSCSLGYSASTAWPTPHERNGCRAAKERCYSMRAVSKRQASRSEAKSLKRMKYLRSKMGMSISCLDPRRTRLQGSQGRDIACSSASLMMWDFMTTKNVSAGCNVACNGPREKQELRRTSGLEIA
jgi:hypothetical protein